MGPREIGELPRMLQPAAAAAATALLVALPRLEGVHTTNAAGRILNHKFMAPRPARSACPSYRAGKHAWRYFNAARFL